MVELSTGRNSAPRHRTYDQVADTAGGRHVAVTYAKRTGDINHSIKGGYQYFRGWRTPRRTSFRA